MSFSKFQKIIHSSDILTTELLSFIFIALASCFLLVHFARWHGKRKKLPPGPRGLPLVGYLPYLGKEPHKTLFELKEKYGDIIGLYMGTKYTVILNEYSIAKEVYNHPGSWDRSPEMFQHTPVGFGSANGKEWIEQRRFSLSAVRDLGIGKESWESLIRENVSNFLEELTFHQDKPVNISHSLGISMTANIIALLIGRKLKKEELDKAQLCLDFNDAFFARMGPSSSVVVIPGLRKLFEMLKIGGFDRSAQVIQQFRTFIGEEISDHKVNNERSTINDFINNYYKKLSSTTPENPDGKYSFSESMLEGNLNALFLGTSDTVISSMGFLMRYMAEYQDIQEKVYKELMDVIGLEGRARYEEKNKIPYTFAVLLEAQRFSSMVPLGPTRRANQDIPIRDYVIPKGADIVVNLYAVHHDSNYWNEPEKFMPERFLTDNGTRLVSIQPLSFAPFSLGRRDCPGQHIAWTELVIYFTELIKNFKISLPPGEKPVDDVILGLVLRLIPHKLCFKKRNQN